MTRIRGEMHVLLLSAVGKGRVMLEGGYTFSGKGASTRSHAVPEALLRIGVFADWFELRLGDTFVREERSAGRERRRQLGCREGSVQRRAADCDQPCP